MQQVQARYEPRDGRLIQSVAQYECKCGVKVTISDPQLPMRAARIDTATS
jgi:hypothetical protein